MFRTVTIFALAGLASAQLQLSQSCMNAFTGIIGNSDANACLNPTALLPLATSNDTSIVGPITNWTQSVCSASPCSNQTLSTIVSSIVNGCQAEIAGISGSSVDPTTLASQITPLVQQYYPTVRQIVCLSDNNNNCLVSTLTNLQAITGPLSLSNIASAVMLGNVPSIPNNITCSDCTKAAYNILRTNVPSIVSDASGDLQQTCGANFTDGVTPAGITDNAADTTGSSGQGNGAMTLVSSGLGVSALTVLSAVFALL
ncbi:hypothetical protein NP233_g7730 [Leucocoprinus birnbaumii]|uniref:Secreted protein n=1 Tax=Leucocoprinus birnbaumii TaxID=56174 RepID=A0AAD5VNQ8_9AGAR|nr:hypothetical protein NP233_g7730 [Leucocoprinus birnbaumii]